MQLAGMLKLKRPVMLHNHVTSEIYKGFEMEFDGPITIAIEQGSLRDEIEKAGGIYVTAALTPSGTIQLKYTALDNALSSDELEKRAQERDKEEIENRKKERDVEREDRVRRNEETLRDGIRMELSDKRRLASEKNQETVVRTNTATAVGAPQVSDEDVEEEFKKRNTSKKSAAKGSSKDVAEAFSPIAGGIGTNNKPLQVKGAKPEKTKRAKARVTRKKK